MSAESAHLSTFGAETETEAEIRSTSNLNIPPPLPDIERVSQAALLGIDITPTLSTSVYVNKMLTQINQRLYLLSQLKLQRLNIQALHTLLTGSYHVEDHVCITCLCRSTYRRR